MRILIVDDDQKGRYFLEVLLKAKGHQVVAVENGARALENLRSEGFDLIISDILMPGMDGFELCRRVKINDRLRHIPFIIYTATYTDPQDEAYALRVGADRFILKPCDPEEFLRAIKEVASEADRRSAPRAIAPKPEEDFKLYSERLVKKLEDKMLQLEREVRLRQEAEQQAAAAAQEWQKTFEAVLDPVAVLNATGEFQLCNPACAEFLGLDRGEIVGRKCYQLVHKTESFIETCPLVKARASGRRESAELRMNGRYFWVILDPIKSPSGEITGFVHIIHDLTEQRQAEESLKEREEWFRKLFEESNISITVRDKDTGEVVDANLNAIRSYGLNTLEELKHHKFWQMPHPYSFDDALQWIQKTRTDGPQQFEWCSRKANGEVFWEQVKLSTINLGGAERILATAVDITQLKDFQRALQESESKYRKLHESMMDGFVYVDMQGRIRDFNESYRQMLGYSAEELLSLTYMDLTPDKWHAFEQKIVEEQIIPKGFSDIYEKEYRRKDGSILPVELRTFLIKNDEGENQGMWAIVRDITERRRAEEEKARLQEQFLQAQKMEAIGRMAGGIAHDFNNLLTVIKGNCQLSLMDLQEGNSLRTNLEEIQKAAESAANLVGQLLAFSRKQVMKPEVINLNHLLADLEKLLRRIVGEKIQLVTIFSDPLGSVKVDRGQIEQAIMNIVVNAYDAMPEGGTITIETKNVEFDETHAREHLGLEPGSYVGLSISDTGIGMTPEIKNRIFEPFFTTKERGKGTGLGLSTAYGIVKQSNGSIWVHSEPGKGSTFWIYLPRVEEPPDELKEPVSQHPLRGHETFW